MPWHLFLTSVGLGLVTVTLGDVVLTVLHPHAESPISSRLHNSIWYLMRLAARPLRESLRHHLLAFAIPAMLVLLLGVWTASLAVGFGLLYWGWFAVPGAFQFPEAGTPPDLLMALYFSGVTLSTLGYGDVGPVHPFVRLMAVVEGLSGLAVVTLTIAYILELYPILQRKRVLAVLLNEETAGKVTGIPLLVRYLGRNNFGALADLLRTINLDLLFLAEAHRRLPVLHYVHPVEPERSFLRVLLVVQHIVAALRYGMRGDAAHDWSDDPRVHDLEDSLFYTLYTLRTSIPLLATTVHDLRNPRAVLVRDFDQLCDDLDEAGLPVACRIPDQDGDGSRDEEARTAYLHFRLTSDPAIARYQRNSGYSYQEALRDAALPRRLVVDLEHELAERETH